MMFVKKCKTCHVEISGPLDYCDHCLSKQHMQRENKRRVDCDNSKYVSELEQRIAYLEKAVRVRDEYADGANCGYCEAQKEDWFDNGVLRWPKEEHDDDCPTVTHPLEGKDG